MWGIRYQVWDRQDRRICKEKWFRTEEARTKWAEKQQTTNQSWAGTDAYCDSPLDPKIETNWN